MSKPQRRKEPAKRTKRRKADNEKRTYRKFGKQ